MPPVSREVHHVGEWKLAIWADTLPEVFVEVARRIAATGGESAGNSGPWEQVTLAAPDVPALLVAWANDLLGRSEVAHRKYDEIRDLHITDARLTAAVRGHSVGEWRSALKAATLHGVEVRPQGRRWKSVILFDV